MPKIIATKKDWIILGYKLFAKSGSGGIIVEKMAFQLSVNKSSFYWHFKTKKEFINEIISYWIAADTRNIIDEVEAKITVEAKFEELVKIVFKKEPHLDFVFFLKRYARKDKKIQALLDQIDKQRLDYTKKLFMQMGISEKQALLKANLFYKYLIGYHEMIRYKKQSKNYVEDIRAELELFI